MIEFFLAPKDTTMVVICGMDVAAGTRRIGSTMADRPDNREERGVMKKSGQAVALAAMVSVAVLGGCTSYSAAPASEYPDGEYVGTSEPDRDGASGEIRFTLEGGKVVRASFMIVDADGTIRDENYGKGAGGEIVDEEFYRLGQNAQRRQVRHSVRETPPGRSGRHRGASCHIDTLCRH